MAAKRLRAPQVGIHSGNDGIPQHAAEGRWWESGPFRTVVTGVAIDALIAVCLLVVSALANDSVDWEWLLAALGKTLLMTVASGVLKRVKPRQAPDQPA